MRYNDGFIIGTGAARNIELGFVPSWVRIVNLTDADKVYEGPIAEAIAFDDGGTAEITAGMRIDAADDGWRGIVGQVLLASGSWEGGDAAGWIVFEPGTLEGAANIGNNDVIHASDQADVKGPATDTDVAAAGLVAVGVEHDPTNTTDGSKMDPESGLTAYYGSHASAARGFSISAAISEDGKLLGYQAWAKDPGSDVIDMSDG